MHAKRSRVPPVGMNRPVLFRKYRHRIAVWTGLVIAAVSSNIGAAQAQIGYSLSAASDDRYRGESTSDRLPVASFAIAYDHPSGGYAGASITIGPTREQGLRLLHSVQYVGYARRLKSGIALDVGLTNRIYDEYATFAYARRVTEGYVGLIGRTVSSHLYFTPDYDGRGRSASYLEVDTLLMHQGKWVATGHIGALAPPQEYPIKRAIQADWRLGLTRKIGSSSVNLNWIGGSPVRSEHHWHQSLILSGSQSF